MVWGGLSGHGTTGAGDSWLVVFARIWVWVWIRLSLLLRVGIDSVSYRSITDNLPMACPSPTDCSHIYS